MKRLISLAVMVVAAACGPSAGSPDSGGGPGGPDAPPGSGPDGSGFGPDARPIADAAPCVATEVTADEVMLPVDIIWVIDNSGSMDAEEARVQNNMNSFASTIAASGIDYHVIVITDSGSVNVPPPLGGSPEFLAVNVSIGSTNPLEKIVETYPMWQAFLRPNSIKHFVAVTDDESNWSQSQFESALAALTAPGFPDGFQFHAIVAEDIGFIPPDIFTPTHCAGLAAAAGQTYIDLQNDHPGLFFSLCETDWSPLFTNLSTAVSMGVALPCTFGIPDPGGGMTIDFAAVNFVYTPTGGTPQNIPYKADMAACGNMQGWYYDTPPPGTPTQIIVCPATCDSLTADPMGGVEVAFGCATIIDG